jgi:hypothetical protein
MGYAIEYKTGTNCTGTDGTTGRTLTLANTSLTSNNTFKVWLNGLLLTLNTSYSVSHNSAHSIITFLVEVWNDQEIVTEYIQNPASVTTLGPYSTSQDVWNYLGKDSFTKVRGEILGTGNATTSVWNFDHDNVISTSTTIYADDVAVGTGSYTLNLDDGKITGYTASVSAVISVDYNYADLPDSTVISMISSSDKLIEEVTGRKFTQQLGEVEYLNRENKQTDFYLRHYPVTILTSVECNTSTSITDVPSWSTSTVGLGNDYIANDRDLELGRFRFIDNYPETGEDRIKVTYDWGYSSVPQNVKELSILLTMRTMMNSSVYKSIFKGNDNFTPVRLAEIENRIQELIRTLKKSNISPI